jgi:hypothetical protein
MDENLQTELTRAELRGLLLIASGYARQAVAAGEVYTDALPAFALLLELAAGELQ